MAVVDAALPAMCVAALAYGMNTVLSGVLVGVGRPGVGARISVLSLWAVAVPSAMLARVWRVWPGSAELWAALAAMHVLQAAVLAWRMGRFNWWVLPWPCLAPVMPL